MKLFKIAVLVLAGIVPATPSLAMDFHLDTSTGYLNMSGPIVTADVDTLDGYLAAGGVTRVTLGPSYGGDSVAGLDMEEAIYQARVPTEDVDICASSCAIIFSGGRSTHMYADQDTENPVLAHCAKYTENTGVSLDSDDLDLTRTILDAAGFNSGFIRDYIAKCNKVNNMQTFDFEAFLDTHGFKVTLL